MGKVNPYQASPHFAPYGPSESKEILKDVSLSLTECSKSISYRGDIIAALANTSVVGKVFGSNLTCSYLTFLAGCLKIGIGCHAQYHLQKLLSKALFKVLRVL